MEKTRERLRAAMENMRAAWPALAGQTVAVREAADLTMRQVGALLVLGGGHAVPLGQLAATLGREVQDALGVLSERRLVEGGPDGYRLSAGGQALLDRIVDMRAALMDDVVSRLPPHERDELVHAFDVLGRALGKAPAPA